MNALHELSLLVSGIPTPGAPQAPPGTEGIQEILNWVKWGCLGLLVVALMIAGARLGFGAGRGDGNEHAGRIGAILMGVIVVSAAGALIGALAS